MAANDFVKRFADFSAGEFGVVDPSKAPDNSFTGQNVLLYESGLVGVRPGLKTFVTSGLPNASIAPGPMGFDVYKDNLVIVIDDSLYRIPLDTGIAVSMGSYPSTVTSFVQFTEGDNYLYSLVDGLLYKHVGDTTANVPLPSGVFLSDITRWGYYLIGVDRNVPWRLWFSKVGEGGPEFDVWEINNYVDIGGNSSIVALHPMFNALLVGKPEGWWSLTGVLASNPSVRFRESGNGPIDGRQVATTTDNRVLYWGQEEEPYWFNGSSVWLDDNYRIKGYESGYPLNSVIATPTGKRMMMLGKPASGNANDTMLVNREREWTTHSLPTKLGGMAPSDVRHAAHLPSGVIYGVVGTIVAGAPINIVSFQHDLERPSRASDEWASPTDDDELSLVTGAMSTPAWYDAQGRMVMVRNVQIQFRKWPNEVENSLNELHVRVRPLARWMAGTIDTDSRMWTEPSKRSDPDGTDDMISFNFGEQGVSLGFQIEIFNMRGIAIREINVACEVQTRRG